MMICFREDSPRLLLSPPLHELFDLLRDALRHVVVDLQSVTPGHELAEAQPLGGPRALGVDQRADSAVARGGALCHAIAVVSHLKKSTVVAAVLVKLREREGATQRGKGVKGGGLREGEREESVG